VIAYGRAFLDTLRELAERARRLRLVHKLRQTELAERAGISVATIRRFEKTGMASFENVLRIATALKADAPFGKLFEAAAYASLDEALAQSEISKRRRAPRRS
jgi:transcriptional regulator with XRE-family HTH domain